MCVVTKESNSELYNALFPEDINSLTNLLIPCSVDVDNIIRKLDNNEELDFYDYLVINELLFCKKLLDKNKD